MFAIVSALNADLPDVESFIAQINAEHDFFDVEREILIARAPGRLDLIGGIADYSGSLVLQYPIREATFAAIQKDPAPQVKIISRSAERDMKFEISLAELGGKLSDYNAAREFFRRKPAHHWAAYVIGVFSVLRKECGAKFNEGARIFISSEVPEGKGVSSSAALEAATMQAVNAAFNLEVNARELALLCQKVENEIVGAPCGVMDQMVSACGEANELLAICCQPAELEGLIKLPDEIEIWGIDSGIRHSVAGADYGLVRAGAFIGYRIISHIAGFEVEKLSNNLVNVKDDKWRGYLANITPSEFEANFKTALPEKITGSEFLKKYHGVTDKISAIEPGREYAVLAPTAHPIYENHRVREFARILGESPANLPELGELMYQSHQSYSACGLGSEGTDLLVNLVKQTTDGLYGAKITGGGSGGTVAVLGGKGAGAAVKAVAECYQQETGYSPRIFSGSSPGVDRFGVIRLLNKFNTK